MLQQPQNSSMQEYMAQYGERLNALLGYAPQPSNLGAAQSGESPMVDEMGAAPASPGMNLGAEQAQPMMQQQPAAAPAAPSAAPAPTTPPMQKNEKGQVVIESRPKDFDFGVKDDDLKDVKSVGDLVQKLPEEKANAYMDWWEERYGQVNGKYDAMLAELGQRPDPKSRDLSRKDKFTLLMEFGLNLMKHSQQGGDRTGAMGAALHDTVRGDQARREKDFERHRSLSGEIEGRRQQDLKAIGTRGDAMVASQNLGAAAAKEGREATEFAERDEEVKNIVYGDEGVVGVTRKGEGRTVTDETGRAVRSTLGIARGSRGSGRGAGGYAPHNIEKLATFYSKTYDIPIEVATNIARSEKNATDPFKMYSTILNGQLRQYMPADEAARVAKELVEGAFGEGALDSKPGAPIERPGGGGNLGAAEPAAAPAPGSSLGSSAPPANLLKSGKVTTIRNKRTGAEEKWTLDETGQPKRVLR
jgi:hypothetical protein